jgi:phosphoserine phosphatase
MEMVGHPVAVYPDKELFTYAKEKGWTVIGDSAA